MDGQTVNVYTDRRVLQCLKYFVEDTCYFTVLLNIQMLSERPSLPSHELQRLAESISYLKLNKIDPSNTKYANCHKQSQVFVQVAVYVCVECLKTR